MAIIQAEVDILKSVEHPYIVRCFDAIDSPDKMYLVMEMCAAAPHKPCGGAVPLPAWCRAAWQHEGGGAVRSHRGQDSEFR